jgi:radical SAM protein with 4Fe4S-binding SPASM domain
VRFDIPPAFISSAVALKNWNGCDLRRCLSILSNGKIALCGLGYQNKGWVLGDIYHDDIPTLWQEHKFLRLLRSSIPARLEGICGSCIMSSLCLGKCRAYVYHACGSLVGSFGFCQEAFELGLFPKSRLHEKAMRSSKRVAYGSHYGGCG